MKSAPKQPSLRESDIQAQIVALLSHHASRNHYIFFSVPNEHDLSGAGNRFAKINKLKKMGLTSGVADLVVVKNGQAYFMEVKTPTGIVSDNQRWFMSNAASVGAHYAIVRSYEEAIKVLTAWVIF
jgi:hypothetical protein